MIGPVIWIIVSVLLYIVLETLLFAVKWLLPVVIVIAVGFWIARIWVFRK